jgi:energy-coupling factor transport system ATP-binding protein
VALAIVERLSFAYPGTAESLTDVSLELGSGEVVALLGPSGSGKTTLLRALAGLVPHFHGGRFSGRVTVAGRDTRTARPAELAGTVATVFQDPEDQVVMARVANEIAFGLENLGVEPPAIWPRVMQALDDVGAAHLADRQTIQLSGGELQRVCLAAALALEPSLLLLDEPTSQLDPDGADAFLDAVVATGASVVLSEQRVARALGLADRVLFMEAGRLLLDAPREEAEAWLHRQRPSFLEESVYHPDDRISRPSDDEPLLELRDVSFSYREGLPAVSGTSLALRSGEVVVLDGPNGSGKTTLAKLAAGLLEPASGTVERRGRVAYLSQDPGRYVVCEQAIDEVALAVDGDRSRAVPALERVGLGWAANRHPRDLSSGERERLALAAVAVSDPDVLILDEPTRGVDPERKAELAAWLATHAASGGAVLVATHDRSFPADRRISPAAAPEPATEAAVCV